jgi:hypothetical protein
MSFADDWGKVYDKSIQAFTGRNNVPVPELKVVVRGTGDLVKSLVALDAINPDEDHEAFVAGQKPLKKAADQYAEVLDTAIAATNKNDHPNAYREVKVLRKHLDLIVAKVASRAVTSSKKYDEKQTKITEKLEEKRKELIEQGKTDEEINKETDWLKQQRAIIGWPEMTKTALAKALAAVQKIKADPTPATYNTEMFAGGRDLSQQMSNVIRLMMDPKCPTKLTHAVMGLNLHEETLAEFGNGEKARISLEATPDQVTAQVREFSALVKEMVSYYDKLVAYLKKHKLK